MKVAQPRKSFGAGYGSIRRFRPVRDDRKGYSPNARLFKMTGF
jgi:hypothetical protein